jgi:hypothetical protein
MLCADRVPIVRAHFKSAMTQTGSPDPRIDLVCITSSCPRQFLQNFGTPSSLPGLTSFNRSGFDATSLWHFDAAEWAPSTASVATGAIEATPRRMSASPRKRPLASKRNPARGHPLAGLVQHSAGLHGVIAAQRPTAGLDRPTIPKLALALRSSVMAITKERISPPSCAERNLHF